MPAPIMNAGFYLRSPQGKTRKVSDGKGGTRVEKLPSSAGRRRDRAVLRDDGHVVYQTLTSHSANLDLESSQANFYRKKTKRLGWIPTAQCPVMLAMSGQLDPIELCSENQDAVSDGQACQPGACSEKAPCKHVAIETVARVERRRLLEEKRAAAHSSKQDKEIQAQRDTQASISEAMNKMTEVLSAPKKGKKGDSERAE